MGSSVSDGKAVESVICLRPPAIEHGKIEPTIQDHFLSARARSLKRPSRIVQPDVHALHEVASDVDVIVLDENHFVREARIPHQLRDLLEDSLARFVLRVRLSSEYELDRPFRIIDHGCQLFDISQNEIRSLVRCEPACEPDGECVRAECHCQPMYYLFRFSSPLRLLRRASPNKFKEPRLQSEVRFPQLRVVHVFDAFPDARFSTVLRPPCSKVAI